MTREEAISVLNDYDINFERHIAEKIAEAHEIAIKAIRTIPSEDEKVIRIKKGTLKARTGKYVVYDVEWLKTHFNTTEAKIYGQPKTGHWIYYKAVNTGEIIWSKCSKCGNYERGCAQRMKYCPECGSYNGGTK